MARPRSDRPAEKRRPAITQPHVRGLIEEDQQLRRRLVTITHEHATEVRRYQDEIARRERLIHSLQSQLAYYQRER